MPTSQFNTSPLGLVHPVIPLEFIRLSGKRALDLGRVDPLQFFSYQYNLEPGILKANKASDCFIAIQGTSTSHH